MYEIMNRFQSVSGLLILICVVILTLGIGGYENVRKIAGKCAVLLTFLCVFFNSKIAVALGNEKTKTFQNFRSDNTDPWRIVDQNDDWKITDDTTTVPSSTSTTSSTSTSTTSTSTIPKTIDTTPQKNEKGQDDWNEEGNSDSNKTPQSNVQQGTGETSNGNIVHIVQKGENLYSIAKLYSKDDVSINRLWVKIIADNKSKLISKNPNLIYPGETITISQLN